MVIISQRCNKKITRRHKHSFGAEMKNLQLGVIILIAAAVVVLAAAMPQTAAQPSVVHEHANFLVFINGQALNLSQPRYMQDYPQLGGNLTDAEKTHMHDDIGWVAHKHSSDVTWGLFFKNINFSLTSSFITLDNGTSYCSSPTAQLRFFVNGNTVTDLSTYPIHDLDRVLITYGSAADVYGQLRAVPDDACIYSEECPWRGSPPSETCSGTGNVCSI
jgi:hypothetical protein